VSPRTNIQVRTSVKRRGGTQAIPQTSFPRQEQLELPMVDHLWRTDRAPASICPYLERGVRFAIPSRIGKHVNITGAILEVDR
jgi:hypothetical protein